MIRGSFSPDHGFPEVVIPIFFGQKMLYLPFVLDTGFSGDLKIDEQTAVDLGITLTSGSWFINANGESVPARIARGYADMDGRRVHVLIIIKDGASLIGAALFSSLGYKVVIDYKNKEAYLERIS